MSSFFRLLDLHSLDLHKSPRAVRQMRDGEIDGIILRGVYDPENCAHICHRLETGQHSLFRTDFPPIMRAFFLGENLNLADPDLRQYFALASAFQDGLRDLFHPYEDLEERICRLFEVIDHGWRYCAAPGPNGDMRHLFTTIRAHLPGGFIPPHFDNEQAFRESYRFVNRAISGDLFSFVLTLSRPEAGGALEIFNISHAGKTWHMVDCGDDAACIPLDDAEWVRLSVSPGDLLLFNSSRYLHRVTPVEGTRTRWTVCSFMSEARSGNAVYCWG